ncbi:cyclic-di-AMP-binding protein CbpB [Evansella cellulosilytica]|uniref:CBS domain containing protein n=1 Tax=Evansella cellulosilytica (strain ATCC 21833 / DSM 2522 / FERM P-1141 / JCM 9156 / N-4) TaxID=649639 RepID=E6TXU5_EVAC2|nr:cyclic-di-AMP-binding protein CbpB [Evansella cellulosilytica]ADU30021.1 CBS domain containing protein [Evansella cellulosilytica DSM 2522]
MQKLDPVNILKESIAPFVISVEKVAHVQPNNTLEHALLILIKSGYTAIPVLDTNFKLHGLITKAQILDSILGIEHIEPERLETTKVSAVMSKTLARMKDYEPFERALSYSINHPFVCVEDDLGAFIGIITRSKLLAYLNGYLHEQKKTK